MKQGPKKWLLLAVTILSMASSVQADEGLTVYGRDGSTYSCAFAQLPVIKFSQRGLSIKPTSGEAMAEKAYSSVAKIDFNVPSHTDLNGDGRVDIADIITLIQKTGENQKADNANMKVIIDEIAR